MHLLRLNNSPACQKKHSGKLVAASLEKAMKGKVEWKSEAYRWKYKKEVCKYILNSTKC
jgi:hypothetical protein